LFPAVAEKKMSPYLLAMPTVLWSHRLGFVMQPFPNTILILLKRNVSSLYGEVALE